MVLDNLFDGKYKIIKPLGKGGTSTVYLAENVKLGTLWAIKEINKKSSLAASTLLEPDILKKLNHPALPRIFDIIEDEENIYIIVDYIEGNTLSKELMQHGKFSEETASRWLFEICNVLIYLHSIHPHPIIYRDMKPSNIILSKDGSIKLIDFGIAREYKSESLNDTVYIGTRGYAAPEQYGNGQTSIRSDIYSLGVTFYHILTGKSPNDPPYELIPLRNIDKSLSKEIEAIIAKCTRNDPNERYQTAKELLNDVANTYKLASSSKKTIKSEALAAPIEKITTVCFKKLVLACAGSSEFVCEMAYIASRITDAKVIVINLDFISSTLDLELNLVPMMQDFIDKNKKFGLKGFSEAMKTKALSEGALKEACFKIDNLYILLDEYMLECYEEYKEADIEALIDFAYKMFDLTFIVINHSILDRYNKIPLQKSDYNIVSINPNLDVIREYENFFTFMDRSHKITIDKTRFAAFEYKDGVSLPKDLLSSFFSHSGFLGCISYADEREKSRNNKGVYANTAYKTQLNEYLDILAKFDIIPRRTLANKIGDWFKNKIR